MTTDQQAQVGEFINRTVFDSNGDKIGTVNDVYFDQDTDQPEWLAVSTGMFGTKISFVPIAGAGFDNDNNVVITYDKAAVKDAPRAEPDGYLSDDEERQLYAHYGRQYVDSNADTQRATAPSSQREAASTVRSEEELSIDKHRQESGRVKLRKWVETDDVHVTVPVQRQMARIVREPATNADTRGVGAFVDDEEEIVMSEEVVDVSKRAVAKERIGLETETVTDQVDVNETVRKERVDIDGDDNLIGKDSNRGR